MPRSSAPPPDEVDALEDDVLGQLGGAPPRQLTAAAMIWRTWSSTAPRSSPGRQHHRLGHAGHELAAPDLGLDLAVVGRRPTRWPA